MVNDYPLVRQGWSGNQLGDLWIGAKINLIAPWRNQNAGPAFALRGMVKIPTAKDDDDNNEPGVGTGKTDFAFDAILSQEVNQRVELSGFAGFIVRGDPDGVDLTNGIRWGFGAGFPTRANLRLTAELHGEKYLDDEILNSRILIGHEDGSIAPPLTSLDSPINASLGLTWMPGNWFLGAGLNYRWALDGRSEFGSYEDETGDSLGFQFRLGYHPGVRIYVPPPPPPPPPPPAVVNRPPSGPGTLQPVHGGSRQDVNRHRRGNRPRRRHADLPLEYRCGNTGESCRPSIPLDRADAGRARPGDRRSQRRQGGRGDRCGYDPGRPPGTA